MCCTLWASSAALAYRQAGRCLTSNGTNGLLGRTVSVVVLRWSSAWFDSPRPADVSADSTAASGGDQLGTGWTRSADMSPRCWQHSGMTIFGPVLDVRALYVEERRELLQLLGSLSPQDWSRPTVCPGWDVQTWSDTSSMTTCGGCRVVGTASPGRSRQ
jgi:hypothetical protein